MSGQVKRKTAWAFFSLCHKKSSKNREFSKVKLKNPTRRTVYHTIPKKKNTPFKISMLDGNTLQPKELFFPQIGSIKKMPEIKKMFYLGRQSSSLYLNLSPVQHSAPYVNLTHHQTSIGFPSF